MELKEMQGMDVFEDIFDIKQEQKFADKKGKVLNSSLNIYRIWWIWMK